MDVKAFIAKLQNLPDHQKKIILWTVVAIAGLAMGYFWVNSAAKGISQLAESTKSIKLPSVNIPSLDMLKTATPSNANSATSNNQ